MAQEDINNTMIKPKLIELDQKREKNCYYIAWPKATPQNTNKTPNNPDVV